MLERKVIDHNPLHTPLKRVLTTWGITLFGIGQMSGGGPFVCAGAVAQMAGPSMVLSFILSGIVALLSAVCFAEFASAIPRTGSGYLFSYVTMGEFIGFFVGWQLILDQILNVASVCSAVSGAINEVASGQIENYTIMYIGQFHKPFLGPYPDFLAVGLGLLAALAMCFGLSRSALLSNVLTTVNLIVIAFCICGGFASGETVNWTYRGFLPFGVTGMLRGASSSFSAYIGFEGIASAGEETINPRRAIPIALLSSVGLLIILYVLMAAALTLSEPFELIDAQSAFPEAFAYNGMYLAKMISSIGISLGMFGALISSLYAVSRTGYAMASDGMFFSPFARISKRTSGPLFGEITFGILAAFFALIFDLEILVEFQNVGTLMAYTIIAGCSIILHYQPRVRVYRDDAPDIEMFRLAENTENQEQTQAAEQRHSVLLRPFQRDFRHFTVDVALVCFTIFTGLTLAFVIDIEASSVLWEWWSFIPAIMTLALAIVSYIVIAANPKRDLTLPFQIPSVPLIPALSIVLNILLLVYISKLTWFRFSVWLILGLIIYFTYGIRHSRVPLDHQTIGTHASENDIPDVITPPTLLVPNDCDHLSPNVNEESQPLLNILS